MALPIVRFHIYTLLIPIPIPIPLLPPLDSVPRTTIFCSRLPTISPNNPPFTIVARNYTIVNLRLPLTSLPNLARLNNRVKRRRPKPKIQPRPPKYY